MPPRKEKGESIRVKLDIMESRALVDGAVLREIRSRILKMSAENSRAQNIDQLLHAAHRVKILVSELENVIGVQQVHVATHDVTSPKKILENVEGRLSAIVSYLRNSQVDTEQIIRDIMSTPFVPSEDAGQPFFAEDMRLRDSPTLPSVTDSRRIPEVSSTNDLPSLASVTAEVIDSDSRLSRSLSPTGKTPWTPDIAIRPRGVGRLPRPTPPPVVVQSRSAQLDTELEKTRSQRGIARLFSSSTESGSRPAPLSRGRTLRRG